jgi:hypothetical protein
MQREEMPGFRRWKFPYRKGQQKDIREPELNGKRKAFRF